ncbi:MAG: sodium:calcium antiporter, partial [Bacteroidaceae bacterium]
MILDVLFIILGFVLLIKGGDWLVDGAVGIARRAKLSPMVIGITVIGFGTSAPELFVSLKAALAQSPGLSIGNVVGSNIANIALILGATAVIIPCSSKRRTLRVDLPVMIGACVALSAVGMSGVVGRVSGAVGLFSLCVFTYLEIKHSRKLSSASMQTEVVEERVMALWKALLLVVVSFALLVVGANV